MELAIRVSVEAAATLETIAPIERLESSDAPVEPRPRGLSEHERGLRDDEADQ